MGVPIAPVPLSGNVCCFNELKARSDGDGGMVPGIAVPIGL
jgi:hypothetical protein